MIYKRLMKFLVIRAGFEPTTRSLEGCCSIQLSYRTVKQGTFRSIPAGSPTTKTDLRVQKYEKDSLTYKPPLVQLIMR